MLCCVSLNSAILLVSFLMIYIKVTARLEDISSESKIYYCGICLERVTEKPPIQLQMIDYSLNTHFLHHSAPHAFNNINNNNNNATINPSNNQPISDNISHIVCSKCSPHHCPELTSLVDT